MQERVPEEDVESTFDLAELREHISYARRAIRRHFVVLTLVAGLVVIAAVVLAWALPTRYRVEARLIAQQDDLIATLSNPGRPPLADDVNPVTRTVSDLVLRRDNLLSIVRDTNLLQRWRASRTPLYRMKDWVFFHHELSDEELTEVLVGTLEKTITVTAQPGAVITFAVVWDDPGLTQKIAEMVMSDFIANRNVNQMAILDETITLLEKRLREADKAMGEMLSSARSLQRPAPTRAVPKPAAPVAAPPLETVELARLHNDIIQKRRALDDLLTRKERTVADLQAQLVTQRAVYSDTHPVVANLRRSIETMGGDSPQILQAREELAGLEARYAARGGSPATLEGLPVGRPSTNSDAAPPSSLLEVLDTISRDPGEEYARGRLTSAIARYYTIADRLQAARIEEEAARANVKFRYIVIKPPLPPRQSTTGIYKVVVIVFGALCAPLFAIAAAAGLQLHRARVVQNWQLERSFGLPVLAVLPALRQR